MAGEWQAERNARHRALLEEANARPVTFDEMEVGKCYVDHQGRILLTYEGYLKSKTVLETREDGTPVYLLKFKKTHRYKNGTKRVFETERVPNPRYDHYYEFPCNPDDDPYERRVHILAARMKAMNKRKTRSNTTYNRRKHLLASRLKSNSNKTRRNSRNNSRNNSRST
jgi:hypothetical protein